VKVFGPIPSRRLGRSLGINNIPPKICSYFCVYCQAGKNTKMPMVRQAFYPPEVLVNEVAEKVDKLRKAGDTIDYLTFAPDGEATLDCNLGQTIKLLKEFGIPIAVITNASLIGLADVQADLMQADFVSLKVDTVHETVWRKLDRPRRTLLLETILAGMLGFTKIYRGKLVTETMLVKGINDQIDHLVEVAHFIAQLHPFTAYLSIPTRPPVVEWVQPPTEPIVNRAYQLFQEILPQVECLIGYEGNAFACTGNVAEDLLSITAVHPMRAEAVAALLARVNAPWEIVEKLLLERQLVETKYKGQIFYTRRFFK